MPGVLDRVGMLISTTGQGTLTASSLISGRFLTPGEAGAVDGKSYYWLLEEGNDFELFIGTWTASGTTVSRDTVLFSKISGTAGTTKMTLAGSAMLRSVAPNEAMVGANSIPLPASCFDPAITNGPAQGRVAKTNVQLLTLDFDSSTAETAFFAFPAPASWNESTVSFIPYWSHPSTTTNFGVVWEVAGGAVSNNETIDIAMGTGQTSTDTGGTTDNLYIGPQSAAITLAGTPAAGDLIWIRIKRLPANASDTMTVDARLHSILLIFTTDEPHD